MFSLNSVLIEARIVSPPSVSTGPRLELRVQAHHQDGTDPVFEVYSPKPEHVWFQNTYSEGRLVRIVGSLRVRSSKGFPLVVEAEHMEIIQRFSLTSEPRPGYDVAGPKEEADVLL